MSCKKASSLELLGVNVDKVVSQQQVRIRSLLDALDEAEKALEANLDLLERAIESGTHSHRQRQALGATGAALSRIREVKEAK